MTCSQMPLSFPPNLEASKAWDREQAEKRRKPPHPLPEVPCRQVVAEDVPLSPRLVGALAERHGWEVLRTYARGMRVGANGAPLPGLTDSIAVRCRKGLDWAVGVWLRVEGQKVAKWGYETGYGWRTGERAVLPERLDFEGLKTRLRSVS